MSLATVSRTLTSLVEKDVSQHHNFDGGGARFEIVPEVHHGHIVDLDTGDVIEFKSDQIKLIQTEIATIQAAHRFDNGILIGGDAQYAPSTKIPTILPPEAKVQRCQVMR